MRAEENENRNTPTREGAPSEQSFDALARGLANGNMSRRQALRWMGGALVGGMLASIPGVALATHKAGHGGGGGGGNSACAHFCTAVFGELEPAHAECTAAAAENKEGNLCQQCLADPTRICPLGEPHCCPGGLTECCGPTACCNLDQGQNCCPQEDRCVTCAEGEVFNPENCQCEGPTCVGNPLPGGACANQANNCGFDGNFCGCLPTPEASFFCIQHGSCGERCVSTLDCPEGKTCVFSCCGGAIQAHCQFPCGVVAPFAAQAAVDGPTTFGG